MQQPVATVNGTPVYSDKQLTKIVNTRLEFRDGSSCDVATGHVDNRGPGSISIGTPRATTGGEKTTRGPLRFRAQALEVSNLDADLHVRVGTATAPVTVAITGPNGDVSRIHVDQACDTVKISSDDTAGRASGVRISGGGSIVVTGTGGIVAGRRIVMRGNNWATGDMVVVAGGVGGEHRTRVDVEVPLHAAVTLMGLLGVARIGDTHGPLAVTSAGGADIAAGKVTSATITVQGSGNVTIAGVDGTLHASVQGSGDVRVRAGRAPTATLAVQGSGDIRFGGVADAAVLTVMGSGDIDIARVKAHPAKQVLGSGDIHVGRVG